MSCKVNGHKTLLRGWEFSVPLWKRSWALEIQRALDLWVRNSISLRGIFKFQISFPSPFPHSVTSGLVEGSLCWMKDLISSEQHSRNTAKIKSKQVQWAAILPGACWDYSYFHIQFYRVLHTTSDDRDAATSPQDEAHWGLTMNPRHSHWLFGHKKNSVCAAKPAPRGEAACHSTPASHPSESNKGE